MISTLFEKTLDGKPRKYCFCDTPELIENYDLAITDKSHTWICHHKLEAFFTSKELLEMNRYYHVSPRDLVFVENETEHHKWPHKGHRGKSPWNKGKHIDNHWAGKKHTEEAKNKNRIAHLGNSYAKGSIRTIEQRQKISESLKGYHWFTNGQVSVQAKECPPGFRPGRTLHKIH